MNRREFLKFLGGAAAAAAVAPQALADTLDVEQAYPVTSPCPPTFGMATYNPGFVVLDPKMMSLQQAIDALPKDGGTVYIPTGTYIVNQEVSIPKGVTLVGEGSVTFAGCNFRAESRGDAPIVFLLDEDDQVEITGSIFDGYELSRMPHWFEVPIGDHLRDLKEKMQRLYLKVKQRVT